MSNSLFPDFDARNHYLSRSDVNEELGTHSRHSFELEGREWPSVEHYYQAMKFESAEEQEKIRRAAHPRKARRMGRSRLRRIRRDWDKVKRVYMTRAVWTKCNTYPAIAEKLLATGDQNLMENSQYDYYWGCGRDRRGYNHYGQILMNVRKKLRDARG
ncbi:NADAR family protein [Haliea sp. E17]|uniref:NADAR family protein n=1 Tax=Haliea sp. E17 TaxID=3401576 RepID=UPI003AAEF554